MVYNLNLILIAFVQYIDNNDLKKFFTIIDSTKIKEDIQNILKKHRF